MPRRYDSADAKRRILTACVRFFLEKGYTRTTVAEIVKEADVSTGISLLNFLSMHFYK